MRTGAGAAAPAATGAMLFTSYEFLLVFLPLTLAAFYGLRAAKRPEASLTLLLVASFAFYGYASLRHLALLGGTIVVNYLLGRALAGIDNEGMRKLAFHVGVAFNLSLIFWFKYFDFAASNGAAIIGADYTFQNIILPIGISFFTFQQLAYLVDCYRTRDCEKSARDYALFVTFFPQLIAGPIVHHGYTRPQFQDLARRPVALDMIPYGVMIFAMGLAKKTLIADPISRAIDPVFAATAAGDPIGAFAAWTGMIGYALQIYFDFSGYCDMAIGLGLMVGVRLPVNFMSPYKARSIIDFWRRWHMTLSAFLRDYVYAPLGGNRRGELLRLRSIFLTMLIGGIWHGAAWTFVVWGLIHAALITFNHAARLRLPQLDAWRGPIAVFVKRAAVLAAVTAAWVFFRSADLDAAFAMLAALFGPAGAPAIGPEMFALIAFAAGLALFAPNSLEVAGYTEALNAPFPRPGAGRRILRPTPVAALATAVMLVGGFAVAWKPAIFIYYSF